MGYETAGDSARSLPVSAKILYNGSSFVETGWPFTS
jgi:hypothetical protein